MVVAAAVAAATAATGFCTLPTRNLAVMISIVIIISMFVGLLVAIAAIVAGFAACVEHAGSSRSASDTCML